MRRESDLSRFLWTLVLVAVIALVITNFAERPLLGGDGKALGFQQPMTLWVASDDPSPQAERVVQQAAGQWDSRTRFASIEVLPGGSVAGVASFLDRVHRDSSDLLVISSTTIADIARERAQPVGSEASEQAHHVTALLRDAPPIAVVCADPLLFAVPRDSSLRDLQGLSGPYSTPSKPLFSIANDSWETSNLAALVERYGLTGRIPYTEAPSANEAVITTASGQASVVFAPRSEIQRELRRGRVRQLPWPPGLGRPPLSWIAIVGPTGLSSGQIASLRHQARRLYQGHGWDAVLQADGLSPTSVSPAALPNFVNSNLRQAVELQSTADRIVHNY